MISDMTNAPRAAADVSRAAGRDECKQWTCPKRRRRRRRKPRWWSSGATKFYQTKTGAVHALDNVSIDVREGEFLCIIGPSGCGKTTLLWSMAGLHRAERRPDHPRRRADHAAASRRSR